jgi:hypothetical protein
MKTIIIVLFTSISCYSQSFMMNMEVKEVYESGTITNERVRVVWRVEGERRLSIAWEDKILNFNKSASNPSKQQRKIIRKIKSEYKKVRIIYDHSRKLQSLYISDDNEVFFVTVYIGDGVLIWVKRLDEKFPCYFFKMVL